MSKKPVQHLTRRGQRLLCALACMLVLSGAQLALAEPGTGIIITRDNGNIDVKFDPSIIPNVIPRRGSNGEMIIHVPNSEGLPKSKLIIDGALKQDKTVQVKESASGKTITINSQQVYLITEDLANHPPIPPTPQAAETKSKLLKTPEPQLEIQPATQTPKVAQASQTPTKKSAVTEKPAPSNPTTKASPPKTETPAASTTIPRPVASTQVLQETLSQENLADSTLDTEALLETTELEYPETTAPPIDPEAIPLDWSDTEHQTAINNSTGMMVRMTVSLVVVLLLLLGFMKVLLPKLVERYPGLFEHLRNKNRERQQANVWAKSPLDEVSKRDKTPGWLTSARQKQADSKQKEYLERLAVEGDRFNVLTSTPLGKGKELHLVEIRGRQLVVATTPYTVTLIKDLTEFDEHSPDHAHDDADTEPAIRGLLGDGQFEEAPSTRDPIETDDYYNPEDQQTLAYLANEPLPPRPEPAPPQASAGASPNRETSAKPYASKPSTGQVEPVAPDSTYLKYLDPARRTEQQHALNQQDDIQQTINQLHQPPAAYVDAEEVVILEDYDDYYEPS